MKIEAIRHLLTFIILCLVQVLVLNHINILGCATPLLYVYFIMQFRRGFPKWAVLTWSFAIGLCTDVFSNTPGVGAASSTLLGLLQPYLLSLFTQRDSPDDMKPTMKELWSHKICLLYVNMRRHIQPCVLQHRVVQLFQLAAMGHEHRRKLRTNRTADHRD